MEGISVPDNSMADNAEVSPNSPRPLPPLIVPHRHASANTPPPLETQERRGLLATILVPVAAFVLGAGALTAASHSLGLSGEVEAPIQGPTAPSVQLAEPALPVPDDATGFTFSQTETPSASAPAGSEPYADAAELLNPSIVQIRNEAGVGSGVFYGDEGLIVTNAHVVGDSKEVSVRVSDGRRVNGQVIGTAPAADIAVVRLDENLSMPPAALALGEPLRVGQIVVAMGSPYGFEQSVSAGIVSAVNRPVPSPTGHLVPMIQTDASINPGNSGGALADRQGRVIGLNSSIRTAATGGGSVGIGFAIPIDVAVDIAQRLVAGETFTPGFLGASGADAVSPVAGVLITELREGTPATKGGILEGDIVVGFGDKRIQTTGQLSAKVLVTPPGSSMNVTVIREGEQLQLDVVIGAGRLPEPPPVADDPTAGGGN